MGFENGKLVRVVMRAVNNVDGDQQVNVFHYDLVDDALDPPNDPQLLADAFRDAVVTPFKGLFSNQWSIQPVEVVQELDPQNPTAARSAWFSGTVQTGSKTISGDLLPRANTVVAKLSTPNIGRRFRGRVFVPGSFTEGEQAAGQWQAIIITQVNSYLNAIPKQPDLVSGLSSSVANWCVYSRTQRGADLDPYAPPVTTIDVRGAVHWLRSRQIG